MSTLDNARMSSLKDKLMAQEDEVEEAPIKTKESQKKEVEKLSKKVKGKK